MVPGLLDHGTKLIRLSGPLTSPIVDRVGLIYSTQRVSRKLFFFSLFFLQIHSHGYRVWSIIKEFTDIILPSILPITAYPILILYILDFLLLLAQLWILWQLPIPISFL